MTMTGSVRTVAAVFRRGLDALADLSLERKFMLYSLMILVAGALAVGGVVGASIRQGVINRTMAVTALFVDSLVSEHLQELANGEEISNEHYMHLDLLLTQTSLGQRIISFKVWSTGGKIVYANDRRLVGRRFPIGESLGAALAGDVYGHISDLRDLENRYELERWDQLVETYAPVRNHGSERVIGAAEFYQLPRDLEEEIIRGQWHGWGVVGAVTLFVFLMLNGTVRRVSNTIVQQNQELHRTIHELTSLHAIVDASIASLSVNRSLELLLQRLVTAVKADAGAIFLLNDNGRLQPRAVEVLDISRVQVAADELGTWVQSLSLDVGVEAWQAKDRSFPDRVAVLECFSLSTALVAPLAVRGELLGVVLVGGGAGCTYSTTAMRLVRAVCERASLFLLSASLAERLQRVAGQKSQTDERLLQRIAHDLHDGPAQDVSLALLRIELLYRKLHPAGDAAAGERDFQMTKAALENALQELRQISAGLRLPELEALTLGQVLKKVCEDQQSTTDSRVDLQLGNLPPVASMPLKITVYRVIQEALRNSYRHGGVREQTVRLTEAQGTLCIEVMDAGAGYAPASEKPGVCGVHLGLRGMQERVELLGGRLQVTSSPGSGTVVRAYLPLGEREEGNASGSDPNSGCG